MKLRFPVLALALALTTIGLHAQGGLYLNPIFTHISNSTPDTGPFAFLGQGGTSKMFGGVVFGGYYDVLHQPKFDVSIDMRDSIVHGGDAALNSFLFGVRLAAKPTHSSFKPYGQLSLGDGRTKSPLSPVHANKFVFNIAAGIDRPINHYVDWRIVEVGYGSVTTISSSLYSGPTAIPAAQLINFSTGLVFRLP
jgi:hypothetical protein